MRKASLIFLLLLPFARSFSQTPGFITDSIDNYITQGMKDWQVPGLAIVIVKDDKIILLKGYGVTDILSKDPVTANTLFMIASNTKLFTATSLAQLEYDKKLSLEDRFTKYFPDFKLYEPATTELLTVKDLLCHRIGTKTFQGDFTFWNSHLTREEIMQKMRLMKPVKDFRDNFGYCNSCFLSAGQVIPRVTGQKWEEYVQDSILTPLQMNSTYTSVKKIPKGASASKAYTTSYTNTLKQVPLDQWDNLGPAAALLSSVSDLSHWLIFQLDSGRYAGQQIMPFPVLQRTRDINTIVNSRRSFYSPTHITGYGLGLFVSDYAGKQVYWHTGGAAGMVSIVSFVPEEKLGIAILTNNDNQDFFVNLRDQILDAYLGVKFRNRSKLFVYGANLEMKKTTDTIAAWERRVKGQTPPLSLAAYAGHYTHTLYGSMDVRTKDGHLLLTFNGHDHLTAALDYMDNGDWLMRYDNIEYGIFTTQFKTENGKVISVLTKENEFVEEDPYTFTKE
jgi:CubicO group peptidase (beta-lactamase class C family)